MPAAYASHCRGHRRAEIVGRGVGAVHTGITQCTLDPGGTVGEHLHSFEKSFYVLEGSPRLTLDGPTIEAGVRAALEDQAKAIYFVAEIDGRVVGQLMITH